MKDVVPSPGSSKRSLPAERHAAQIVRKVQEHPVVFVSGRTGCGKSTKVPQALMEEFGGRAFQLVPFASLTISTVG